MEDRIRFIDHNGHRILFVDLSHCSSQEFQKIVGLVPKFAATEPKGSILLLADFTGAEFDREGAMRMKEATVFDRPYLKRSAWFGTESIPHVYYENIKSFSKRDLPTFKTREEAMDWLVQDEKLER